MKRFALPIFILLLLSGCSTLFTGTVTLTKVVEDAGKEYVKLWKKGLISPEVDAKVEAAYAKYYAATQVAKASLIQYKETQDEGARIAALEAVRTAATAFIDRVLPLLLDQNKAADLKADLAKARNI